MQFFFFRTHTKNSKRKQIAGFSLVELMLTIGIVVLVTGAVLARNTSFTATTLLKSQALEISLDLRAAQQYGVNVRADSPNIRTAYGVYVNAADARNRQIILFLDANDNFLYDAGEEIEGSQLDSRFVIKEICVPDSSNNRVCAEERLASVAFKRPNFDAVIANSDTSGSNYGLHSKAWLEIVVAPADGTPFERSVFVYESGQITVQ
jgi:type II secretory pathway pseudopilin PulG